jgi:hypothetical protein
MKKAYLFLTIATVIVAVVLLIFSGYKETIVSPEQKRANAYVPDPSEYQLVIEDDSIIISDFGRPVSKLHLNQIGELETVLIKDNE